MLNDFSNRTRAIRAALELVQAKPWRDITLAEIANRANLSLSDIRGQFDHKAEILAAFQQEVDRAVLERVKGVSEEDVPRERLLDVLMTRFEVMAPFRPALAALVRSLSCHPSEAGLLVPSALVSQYWMLAGAGIPLSGLRGGAKVAGLAAIYGQALRIWLEDDSPGNEKTMAFVDRRLRRGETVLRRVGSVKRRLFRAACGCGCRAKGKTDESVDESRTPGEPAGEGAGA